MSAAFQTRNILRDMSSGRAPVRLIHVRRDWLVHHSHSEKLAAAAGNRADLKILDIDGRYHADRIFSAAPGLIEGLIVDFLSQTDAKRDEPRESRGP